VNITNDNTFVIEPAADLQSTQLNQQNPDDASASKSTSLQSTSENGVVNEPNQNNADAVSATAASASTSSFMYARVLQQAKEQQRASAKHRRPAMPRCLRSASDLHHRTCCELSHFSSTECNLCASRSSDGPCLRSVSVHSCGNFFGRLFAMLDDDSSGQLSFSQFVIGAAIFLKSNRAERLGALFAMCCTQTIDSSIASTASTQSKSINDINSIAPTQSEIVSSSSPPSTGAANQQELSSESSSALASSSSQCLRASHSDLLSLLTMFDTLYNGSRRSSKETELFVQMAMERSNNQPLSYEEFAKMIVLHPIANDIFRLDSIAD
jgi:hypothetical protein